MTLGAADIARRDDTCPGEPIRLVYVGDLVAYKGLEYLIRAMALLGELSPHRYVLTVVGAGPLSEELCARAASEVPDGRIRFVGYVSDQLALLRNAPVHCLHGYHRPC